MKPYSLEHWLAAAAILAALIAIHWLAYRVQARRIRKRRREPQNRPTVVPRRRQDGFDGPIPIPLRTGRMR
jgi:peptidoglycan/LPS O-acetylase OafA/YrhL